MRRLRKAIKVMAVAGVIMAGLLAPVNTAYAAQAVPDSSVVMRTGLQWYYKYENGHNYKRLMNTDTGEWITDWILCD